MSTMTVSAFAAARMPGMPETGSEYRPGICNIGPAEISRRRLAGHVGLLVTVVLFAALLAIGAPPIARLVLALPAAGSAAGYLQAWLKFCAAFGSRGIFNFGSLGRADQVASDAARTRDRIRAYQIGLASLGIGVVLAVVAVLLPL
jgi:hypothetical protein